MIQPVTWRGCLFLCHPSDHLQIDPDCTYAFEISAASIQGAAELARTYTRVNFCQQKLLRKTFRLKVLLGTETDIRKPVTEAHELRNLSPQLTSPLTGIKCLYF